MALAVLGRVLTPEESLTVRPTAPSPLKLISGPQWLVAFLLLGGGPLYGQEAPRPPATATAQAPPNGQAAPKPLPPGDGRDLVIAACTQCHGLDEVVRLRDGAVGWKNVVDYMILRGAQLQPDEAEKVIHYLTISFGPGNNPMQSGAGAVVTLPNAPGRELVVSHCTACHDAGRITGANRTREEWDLTVRTMTAKANLAATPEETQAMVSYLFTQFGKKAE